jgi:hypothetical protein
VTSRLEAGKPVTFLYSVVKIPVRGRGIRENSGLGTGTQTSYQDLGKIPGWRRGIFGKTPAGDQDH